MRGALLLLAFAGCSTSAVAPRDAGAPEAGDPGSFARTGVVDVTAYSYPVGSHTFSGGSIGATFVDASGFAPPTCAPSTEGACTLSLCGPTSDAAAPSPRSAGTVTVSGLAGGPITLTPAGGAYAAATSAVLLFAAGDAVTASAPGDPLGAPAFQRDVKAPSFVFVTDPPFPGTGPVSVDRTRDLPVVWSGGTTGTTTVTLSGPSFRLACSAPAAAGTVTVPASALAKLPRADASALAVLSVSTLTVDRRSAGAAGDWGVELRVTAQGARPGGLASAALLLP